MAKHCSAAFVPERDKIGIPPKQVGRGAFENIKSACSTDAVGGSANSQLRKENQPGHDQSRRCNFLVAIGGMAGHWVAVAAPRLGCD
jgi:hypothetical protein